MSTYRVVFSERVEAQLRAIWDYIAVEADPAAATRTVERLVARCLLLDTFPERGTPHEEYGPRVRTVAFRRSATIGNTVMDRDVVIVGIAWRGQLPGDAIGVDDPHG
ncbi:MAG: toxin ParE1/3/4 [Sphingomonadales bacterium]|nr:toxin ParE1/3/4 [Sphingomonadales bacterium]